MDLCSELRILKKINKTNIKPALRSSNGNVIISDHPFVYAADMCIVVECWRTNESLCDIGPMPWGDGVFDVQDLIVLAKHLCEEFPQAEHIE